MVKSGEQSSADDLPMIFNKAMNSQIICIYRFGVTPFGQKSYFQARLQAVCKVVLDFNAPVLTLGVDVTRRNSFDVKGVAILEDNYPIPPRLCSMMFR